LLATVTNPLPGDKAAGAALRAGHFLVHGLKQPIAQLDLAGRGRWCRRSNGWCMASTGWPIWRRRGREQVSPVAERILAAG
jgi:hypothetical protein